MPSTQTNGILVQASLLDTVAYSSPSVDSNGNVQTVVGQNLTANIVLSSFADPFDTTNVKRAQLTITGVKPNNNTVYSVWWMTEKANGGNYSFSKFPTSKTTNDGSEPPSLELVDITSMFTGNSLGLKMSVDGSDDFTILRAQEYKTKIVGSFWRTNPQAV